MSAFIGYPENHRVLAAGDLNISYGTIDPKMMPERERTVWDRMEALGMVMMGPQFPNDRQSSISPPGVPPDTKNVPTYSKPAEGPKGAKIQLDYVFASQGFHNQVKVRAMNEIEEWGPSDHCRLKITVS